MFGGGRPFCMHAALQRIEQQAGDGHRPDAARHRRDRAGHVLGLGIGDVADDARLPPSPATRLMPTSITVAPGLIQCAAHHFRPPDRRDQQIGAARTPPAGRAVLECAMVTVAFSASSNCATGLPTMLERPITTASSPASE